MLWKARCRCWWWHYCWGVSEWAGHEVPSRTFCLRKVVLSTISLCVNLLKGLFKCISDLGGLGLDPRLCPSKQLWVTLVLLSPRSHLRVVGV